MGTVTTCDFCNKVIIDTNLTSRFHNVGVKLHVGSNYRTGDACSNICGARLVIKWADEILKRGLGDGEALDRETGIHTPTPDRLTSPDSADRFTLTDPTILTEPTSPKERVFPPDRPYGYGNPPTPEIPDSAPLGDFLPSESMRTLSGDTGLPPHDPPKTRFHRRGEPK